MLTIGNNHEPKTIDDIIFGNPESKLRIQDIVSGTEPLPSFGKSAILLYGIPGSGKTTLANMLPNAIEKNKSGCELVWDAEYIGCQQGFNGPQVMTFIQNIMGKSTFNKSGLHYMIIDEVDHLSSLAHKSLKTALNTARGVFILTTNNLSQLDKGLLDRCVLVEMNAANPNAYLDIAKSIVNETGVTLSNDELLPTIQAANGSFRNLFHNISRLARRKSQQPPLDIIY